MAKTGRGQKGQESIGGFFRQIFQQRPELLRSKNNLEIMGLWDAAHPGQSPANRKRVMQNMANVKSVMRKRLRKRGPKALTAGRPFPGKNGARLTLDLLEEHIDDSLSMAKRLDRDGLDSVIKLLRRARNEVVLKAGQ